MPLRHDESNRIATHDDTTAHLTRIRVYPFKSLDGVDVARSTILPGGALWRDREVAFFDEAGAYVNAKRNPKVHALRVRFDDRLSVAHFTSTSLGEHHSYVFEEPLRELEVWLGRHFGQRIVARRNSEGGFPDDMAAAGPTIVSTATLETVAGWFPDLGSASLRERLRSNLELGGAPAFWEDHLYGAAGSVVVFRIGDVELHGTNPCARCVVPSRDARTGEPMAAFAKIVAERRAASLPPWANRTRFDHYYRLAGNTRCAPGQAGKTLALGDVVRFEVPSAVQAV